MQTEPSALELLASHLVERDAAYAADHVMQDFLAGLDLTSMTPDDVETALSSYVVGSVGLCSEEPILFEPLERTLPTLQVVNTYRFLVPVRKSDYLTNFIYVPLIMAAKEGSWQPASAVCSDGVLRITYETTVYGDGEQAPSPNDTVKLQEDPLRRIDLAEAALDANRKILRARDDVIRNVARAYRKRWNRACDASQMAREITLPASI